MKYTLLDIVKRILEAMDSDEVNSIGDTTEALTVANIIKESYFTIVAELGPKEIENLFHLDAGTDNTKPTVMFLPSNVDNIHRLKYNIGPSVTDTNLRELRYLDPMAFLEYMNGLDVNEDWVGSQIVSLDGSDFQIKYRNDVSPNYWTSTDDRTIILDAFDHKYEDTNSSARTYGYGMKVPIFLLEDTFIPDLDARHFPLLINSAKATAFTEIKQTSNERAEKIERKHTALAHKTKDSTDNRSAIKRHKGYGRR